MCQNVCNTEMEALETPYSIYTLDRHKILKQFKHVRQTIRLSVYLCNVGGEHFPGRKNIASGFTFGKKIGSFSTQVGIETEPNRAKATTIPQHNLWSRIF